MSNQGNKSRKTSGDNRATLRYGIFPDLPPIDYFDKPEKVDKKGISLPKLKFLEKEEQCDGSKPTD